MNIGVLMQACEIDFKRYSTEQLIDSLEAVDIDLYPDRALSIYQLILDRLGRNHKEVNAETLGYTYEAQNQSLVNKILYGFNELIGYFFDDFISERRNLAHNQMQEKIDWLNEQMTKEPHSGMENDCQETDARGNI